VLTRLLNRLTKIRTAALIFLGGAALAVLLTTACQAIAEAHAASVEPGVPVIIATTAADSGWDIVVHQGPLLGGLLIAYALFRRFLSANDSQHWIAQGKTLSMLTGAAMVLGAVVDWKFAGAPAAGIVTSLFAAISLTTHSTVSVPPPTVTATASRGTPTAATLAVLLLAGGVAMQPACSSWRARTTAGVSAFIDCESPHIDAQLLADATALSKVAVMAAISGDGHADTAQLKADAAPLKSDLLRCGFAAAVAALATPVPKQPGAPAAAGVEVDGVQLRAAFAGARGELGWAPVKLAGGTVL